MMFCPSCNIGLPSRGVFCPACGAQAKCRNCKELLEPGAVACVECGTRVDDGQLAGSTSQTLSSVASEQNVLRMEETRTSRTLEVRFTDAAVESLGVPLSAYLGGGLAETRQRQNNRPRFPQDNDRSEPKSPVLQIDEANFVDVRPSSESISPPDDRELLHAIFGYEDQRVRLKDPRIKADTKIEYVDRLTCLFVYAHELEGRSKVARSAINTMLTESTLYDGNARTWISETTCLIADGEMIELSVPGKERASETLRRNKDPNITSSFLLGASTRSRATKVEVSSSDDAGEAGTKTGKRRSAVESKKIDPWVGQWKAASIQVDAFKVLQGKSSAEKGLFGLWAIRKVVGDAAKVVSRVKLSQFLYQAFEVQVNDATLAQALKGSTMKDKVIHIGGTRFQITPNGMTHVEQMIGDQPPPTVA